MITFLSCLFCHSFGKRQLPEIVWLIALWIGFLEILCEGIMLGAINNG